MDLSFDIGCGCLDRLFDGVVRVFLVGCRFLDHGFIDRWFG
jgi:hypothetical protein